MIVIVREFLQIVRKQPDNRTRQFVSAQGGTTFFRALSDWTVPQSSRDEAPHVLHQKELGLHDLYVVEKLPQESASRILRGTSSPGRAERLARWAAHKQIDLAWHEPAGAQYFLRINMSNVSLEHLEVRV